MVLPALGGCGEARNQPAEDVAAAFYDALAHHDGGKACRLLAPATRSEVAQAAGKPCAKAILEEKLPRSEDPEQVEVFGTAAKVRTSSDTAFLGEFPDGWHVVAAGCAPRDRRPFDCQVSGG